MILLSDLAIRSTSIVDHYTDRGVLPRPARITAYEYSGDSTAYYWWSFHMINGSAWMQAILFGAAAWFSVWLLIGYRTRFATIGSWILLVSLHSRLPTVNQGGDVLLRSLLFWSIFVPLGIVFSVDRKLYTSDSTASSGRIFSMATACLLLQLPLMYWFSAAAKSDPVWNQDYTAIYFALELDLYVKPLGAALRGYPKLLQLLTFATYWLEWIGPVLAFIPWRISQWRLFTVALFWSFHISLALTLHLGLFSWIAMAGWLLYLPQEFWDQASHWLRVPQRKLSDRLPAGISMLQVISLFQNAASPCYSVSRKTSIALALAFAAVTYSNAMLTQAKGSAVGGPEWLHDLIAIIRMEQPWLLFAPAPGRNDGWLVARGGLVDGTEVNLWQPDQPIPWDKPESISSLFPNHRWRKLIVNLCWEPDNEQLSCFSDWLCWRWNEYYSGGRAPKEVRTVEIIFQLERTPDPGEVQQPIESIQLWYWDYQQPNASNTAEVDKVM